MSARSGIALAPALALAVAAVLALAGTAHAQDDIGRRRVGVRWDAGAPSLAFSASDMADRAVREKLRSGLFQTLVMRLYAYREDGQPVSVAFRQCRVVYDLWEEVYRVQVQENRADRVESFGNLDAVVRRCLVASRITVGRAEDYRDLAGQSIYFAVLVELNPPSPDMVHNLRRWLARPAGGDRVGGTAFFGSFVSLFVNRRIADAERQLRFRSQPVTVPP